MATVYDHCVGLLPNGKPLNVVTHGDHIKVILPPPESAADTARRGKKSPKRLGKGRNSNVTQSLGYDSLFKTNNYHIINGKDDEMGEY